MRTPITEEDLKQLKLVRNYFGEHDKTLFEHRAYSILDSLLKKLRPVVHKEHLHYGCIDNARKKDGPCCYPVGTCADCQV